MICREHHFEATVKQSVEKLPKRSPLGPMPDARMHAISACNERIQCCSSFPVVCKLVPKKNGGSPAKIDWRETDVRVGTHAKRPNSSVIHFRAGIS